MVMYSWCLLVVEYMARKSSGPIWMGRSWEGEGKRRGGQEGRRKEGEGKGKGKIVS